MYVNVDGGVGEGDTHTCLADGDIRRNIPPPLIEFLQSFCLLTTKNLFTFRFLTVSVFHVLRLKLHICPVSPYNCVDFVL